MLLARGPIPVITSDWYNSALEDPGNTTFVNSFDPQFSSVEALLDATIDPLALIDVLLPDDGNQPDIDALDAGLAAYIPFDNTPEVATGDLQLQNLAEQTYAIYASVPGEVWQPLPAVLSTPLGQPPTSPPSSSTVSIVNLTRPGATDFLPGEDYYISGHLSPALGGAGIYAGVDVSLYPTQNGTPMPIADLCLTDQNGFWAAEGTFQDDDIGDWVVTVAYTSPSGSGGINNGPVAANPDELTFTVNPSPTTIVGPGGVAGTVGLGLRPVQTLGQPCITEAITVVLVNAQRPGATDFLSGEGWLLTVNGPPDSNVSIAAIFNGQPLPWVILGQTDAVGVFFLQGQMTDAVIGSWIEYYEVGSLQWDGTLKFTVGLMPAPAPPAPASIGVVVPPSTPPPAPAAPPAPTTGVLPSVSANPLP